MTRAGLMAGCIFVYRLHRNLCRHMCGCRSIVHECLVPLVEKIVHLDVSEEDLLRLVPSVVPALYGASLFKIGAGFSDITSTCDRVLRSVLGNSGSDDLGLRSQRLSVTFGSILFFICSVFPRQCRGILQRRSALASGIWGSMGLPS